MGNWEHKPLSCKAFKVQASAAAGGRRHQLLLGKEASAAGGKDRAGDEFLVLTCPGTLREDRRR